MKPTQCLDCETELVPYKRVKGRCLNCSHRWRYKTDPAVRAKDNARGKRWRDANREKLRDSSRARYASLSPQEKERLLVLAKEHRAQNMEKFRAKGREYYRKNKDKINTRSWDKRELVRNRTEILKAMDPVELLNMIMAEDDADRDAMTKLREEKE